MITPVTAVQKTALTGGRIYIDVHTAGNVNGEIRGQVVPSVMKVTLNGANERPTPVVGSATGVGTFMLGHNQLGMVVTYRDLSGVAAGSSLHGPAGASQTATPLLGLEALKGGSFGTAGAFAGSLPLTPQALGAMVDGLTYINILTPLRANGEIRGQVVR